MIRFIIVALTVIGFLVFSAGYLHKMKKLGRTDQEKM